MADPNRPVLSSPDGPLDTPRCWAHHLGIWAIEPLWFQQAIALVRVGAYPMQALVEPNRAYDITPDGIGIIPLVGPLSKGLSKFGGTSSVLARRAVRQASQDPDVSSILLLIDSPGGHVAGTQALASDIRRIDRQIKPVVAHIEDLGASAAYWIASQARRITAAPASEVGSIGTMSVLEDTSGQMDRLGIHVHVIATGPYKGIGVEGTPISDEALGYVRDRVVNLNNHFVSAVQQGRRLTPLQLDAVTDGQVWIAERAQHLGLIDAIEDVDTTLISLRQMRPSVAQSRHLDALLSRKEEFLRGTRTQTS